MENLAADRPFAWRKSENINNNKYVHESYNLNVTVYWLHVYIEIVFEFKNILYIKLRVHVSAPTRRARI